MPPIVKAYEAMGAMGDGRVRMAGGNRATVVSSQGDKAYEVEISEDGRTVTSNDNASYWQGYLGYPAIAALIGRGMYRPPANVIDALADIPWKEINRRYRNNYAKTVAEVLKIVEERGHDPEAVRIEAEAVLQALQEFAPLKGARRRPPGEAKRGNQERKRGG